jgi:phage terminase large subunit
LAVPTLDEIRAERARRQAEANRDGWEAEKARCAADPTYWFDRYAWTFDPRLIGKPGGAFVPFRLWPKQRELVRFLEDRLNASGEGLIEKSRDVGASYVCAGFALWAWLFKPGFKATFGSRVVDDVDQKDNPDAIFEKLRIILRRLPEWMTPAGFNWGHHNNYMRIVNPENGATITGEGGENMGRGGRSTMYFLDEAARVPNADAVEKALSGNTDCVLWVSSVNGMGNLFARKRHSILKPHQIFRLHWRDDPRKTEEWAAAKQASFADPTTWASEYDIDYSASVEGICIPAIWVESCKRLQTLEPRLQASNDATTGLDVGAGKAKSVAITRAGPVVGIPTSRRDPDTTETALWALDIAKRDRARTLNFDAPGVGAGVSSTLTHNQVDGLAVNAINTGLPPSERTWEDGRTSEEMFANMKAEVWWLCRSAAQRTHEHVLHIEGKGGKEHPLSDLLALPSGDAESDALCLQMSLVKWGKNEKGKIVIEKKDALARRGIASPDHADALMLTWAEVKRGYQYRLLDVLD